MNKSKRVKPIIGCIVLFMILLISFIWTSQKEGYFVDELYTYGLSNSYYAPFLEQEEGYLNAYHSGEDFFEYLTVSDEDAFQFDSVWYNQAKDVHPPFYYVIIHLVSSVFKETISPWIGVGVNYFFYILSLPLFYYIAKDLCRDKKNAVIAAVFFAVSAGTINCLVFIRMYMMLMFWILLYTWLMIQFFRNKIAGKMELVSYVAVYSVIVCGFLTHYHFIIPAVILSLLYIIYLLVGKKFKNSFYYIISCVAAAVTTQYIFEYSFNHIFVGYRGVEAIRNAKSSNLFERMSIMWDYIDTQIFGGCFIGIILILITALIVAILKHKKDNSMPDKNDVEEIQVEKESKWIRCSLIITVVVTFAFISKTAAFLEARYLFGVYPLIILAVIFVIDRTTGYFRGKVKYIVVSVILAVCVILSYGVYKEPAYLYRDNAIVPGIISENYNGTKAVYITDQSYRYVSDSYVLSFHDDIYIADFEIIDHMLWFEEDNQVILYINHWLLDSANVEEAKEPDYYLNLAESAGYVSCEYIGSTEHSRVYVLSR